MQFFHKLIYLLIFLFYYSNAQISITVNNKINTFDINLVNKSIIFLTNSEKNDIENFDFPVLNKMKEQNIKTIDQDNLEYFAENFVQKYDSLESNKISDSSGSKILDTILYVPYNEFFIADQPRYTFTGEPALKNTKLRLLNTVAIFGTYSVIFYVQHEMQQNTIWKNVGDFHIQEDIQYSLFLDKFGHFYGGYSTSYLLGEMLQLAGFSWDAATIWGSALGLSYMTYIEVLDGYSKDFGFSPSDFYADIAGSAFYIAQHYVPILQNFSPKFEYVNPKWLGELDRKPHDSFIDNYSAQAFWMSVNIRNLFGGVVKEYCPEWINLSIGYAVYSLSGTYQKEDGTWDYYYPENLSHRVNSVTAGNRKLIIALDYDLSKLLPDGPPFWNWMKQSLNLFKLPAPAVEFGFEGKTKVYLLYPFEFRLSGLRF